MAEIRRSEEVFLQDLEFDKDFGVTTGGDLQSIHGLENLRQAVIHRLLTVPGTIPLQPGYGIGIGQYQGDLNRLSTQENLLREIQEQFSGDDRIEAVESLSVRPAVDNPSQLTIRLKIRAVGRSQIDLEVDIGGQVGS